jgi:hypothetical protein
MEAVQAAEPVAVPAPDTQKPDPAECGFLLSHGCTGPRQRLSESHCETGDRPVLLPSVQRRPVKRAGEYLPPEPGFLHDVQAMDTEVFLAEDPSWSTCLWTEWSSLPACSGLPLHPFETEHQEADPCEAGMLSPAPWSIPQPCATPLVIQSEPGLAATTAAAVPSFHPTARQPTDPITGGLVPIPEYDLLSTTAIAKLASHSPLVVQSEPRIAATIPAIPSVELTLRQPTDPITAGLVPLREHDLHPTSAIATLAFHCSGETWLSDALSTAVPAFQPDPAACELLGTELAPYVPFSPNDRAPVDTFRNATHLSWIPALTFQQCLPKFAVPQRQPRLAGLEESPLFLSDPFDPESGASAPHSMHPEAAHTKPDPWFPNSGYSPAVNHRMEPRRAHRQPHTYEPRPRLLASAVLGAPFEVSFRDVPACDLSALQLRNVPRRRSGPPVSRGILRAPLTPRDPGAAPFLDPIPVNFGSAEEVWQPQI